ncbi:hypothetical protein [Clostridium sp. Marseille-P299]|uniref:hypothetical protein n=1 Tax=Clostridium sp. Marseille-P299 TaxID=1805477 RepID=UPI000834FF4B|nr:hypothetical protein [Clostridium sp. Marseille-P299]
MKEILEKIELMSKNKRRIVLNIVIFFLIFEAIVIFPLKYEFSIMNASIIYCYFILGFALCATTRRKSIVILLGITFTNVIGLGLRILLEWGEYSMIRDLTYKNVLLTYFPIIAITFISYLYTKNVIQRKSNTV